MNLFDFRNPWFQPIGRRVAVFLVCLIWGVFELSGGNLLWAIPFLGLAAWSGWVFFIDWQDVPDDDEPGD